MFNWPWQFFSYYRIRNAMLRISRHGGTVPSDPTTTEKKYLSPPNHPIIIINPSIRKTGCFCNFNKILPQFDFLSRYHFSRDSPILSLSTPRHLPINLLARTVKCATTTPFGPSCVKTFPTNLGAITGKSVIAESNPKSRGNSDVWASKL